MLLRYFLMGVLIAAFYLALCVAAWLGAFDGEARAHDALPTASAPLGWSYPFSCCSGYDCRQVPPADVFEGPDGYRIVGTGEVLAYSDSRIKDSPDGEFHWCSVAGKSDGKTICLFVPPRGF